MCSRSRRPNRAVERDPTAACFAPLTANVGRPLSHSGYFRSGSEAEVALEFDCSVWIILAPTNSATLAHMVTSREFSPDGTKCNPGQVSPEYAALLPGYGCSAIAV